MPENFLGALSRSSGELAEEARGESEQERKLYSNEIVPAHDAWWVMRVAESAGESVPGLAASALNPVFGLSLMYAQTYEVALEEYRTSAEERGAPFRIEDAERYARAWSRRALAGVRGLGVVWEVCFGGGVLLLGMGRRGFL